MKQGLQAKRLNLLTAALVFVVLLLAELLFRSGHLQSLENPWSDLWFRLAGQTREAKHVALVELDDQTLALHPDDPLAFWTPYFAKAAQVLQQAGAKLVAIDFHFGVSAEAWLSRYGAEEASRNYNQPFRQVVSTGKVILGGSQSSRTAFLPASEYLLSLPEFDVVGHVGAADLVFDNDGTLRRVYPLPPGARQAGKDELKLLSFPLLLAIRASGQDPKAARWKFGARVIDPESPPWILPYSGPPAPFGQAGSVPTLSMRELLADNALCNTKVQAMRDRVVIIGARYTISNDAHLTPYAHGIFGAQQMPGPEIIAQATEALLSGRFFDPLGSGWRLLGLALSLTIAACFWVRFSMWRGLPILAAGIGISAIAGYGLHRVDITFPTAHYQLALLILFMAIYGLRFSSGERERNLIRKTFSSYVSPEVVDSIASSGHMPSLGGESMQVTVLFSDIRNFTTLSERLNPGEVVEILNTYFQQACTVLQSEGACIDKFIGDAVMAEFGAPIARPDDARRAIRAALRLRQTAIEFRTWMQQRFPGRDLPEFEIGIGLHTGLAVIGNIGAPSKMQYTAIGDTVNLASRLEGLTKPMGCTIVASRSVIEAAGSGITLGKTDTVRVKGRDEPVEVFEVLSLEDSNHA